MERLGKLALFGHQAIGTGRHMRAVVAAALAGSAAASVIGVATTGLVMARAGAGSSATTFAISALAVLAMMFAFLFIFYSVTLGIAFSGARALLGRTERNFGAFYLALAVLLGTIEALLTSRYRGGLTMRELVFGITIWLLMALVYWMVAGERRRAGEQRVAEAFR